MQAREVRLIELVQRTQLFLKSNDYNTLTVILKLVVDVLRDFKIQGTFSSVY